MDLFDKLFRAGPAVQVIFKLGFMPKEKDFYELTPKQYECYYLHECQTEEKVFALLPQDAKCCVDSNFNELIVFTESDIEALKKGWQIVESYCEKAKKDFSSEREKLEYAASKLPEVFSKGTPFEYAHNTNLRISYLDSETISRL